MNSNNPDIDPHQVLEAVIYRVGGDNRDGQAHMVAEVADAIRDHEHRIIQAGTGTGKSLGYLVPAATHALNPGGGTVIVATATLALQRQLVSKDLPVLADTLRDDFGRTLKYAVLKGRNNYVCLQKLHSTVPDPGQDELFETPSTALGQQAVAVREWAENTDTGDRDDFDGEIDSRVWRAFSVSRRECVGETKCSFGEECFTAKRRAVASEAHIVVTNHALLAIDVIEGIPVLPEHEVVVIDEGHEIVDRATGAISTDVSVAMIERAASAAKSLIDARTLDLIDEAATAFGDAVIASGGADEGVTRLESIDPELTIALTLVRDAFHAAIQELGSQKPEDPEVAARDHRIRGGLEEIHDTAGAILTAAHALSGDSVVWVENMGRTSALHSAPLSVAQVLSSKLFDEKSVIVTSATLTTRGNFENITRNLGIINDPRSSTLDVGSPFDYPQQGILYVATHVDPPTRDGISMQALDEMGELIEAAGGRTLILCSSWRAVDKVSEYLRVRIDTPLLVHRRGEPAGLLVQRFAEDEQSSLVGTLSLWQGVDVPGSSCSQVIIDRIPFPRPDDPIMSARSNAVDQAGGSGFNEVMVARAGLLLAQAAGRLIRSATDRGVVSVLDPRLARAGYAKSLRASMPPLWFTTDKDVTLSALTRLSRSVPEARGLN